jgi:hypothetical protein
MFSSICRARRPIRIGYAFFPGNLPMLALASQQAGRLVRPLVTLMRRHFKTLPSE